MKDGLTDYLAGLQPKPFQRAPFRNGEDSGRIQCKKYDRGFRYHRSQALFGHRQRRCKFWLDAQNGSSQLGRRFVQNAAPGSVSLVYLAKKRSVTLVICAQLVNRWPRLALHMPMNVSHGGSGKLVTMRARLLTSDQHGPSPDRKENQPRLSKTLAQTWQQFPPVERTRHHYWNERIGEGFGIQSLRGPRLLLCGQSSGALDPKFCSTGRSVCGN